MPESGRPPGAEMATHSSILAGNILWTGAWRATVFMVTQSWTWLSDWAQHSPVSEWEREFQQQDRLLTTELAQQLHRWRRRDRHEKDGGAQTQRWEERAAQQTPAAPRPAGGQSACAIKGIFKHFKVRGERDKRKGWWRVKARTAAYSRPHMHAYLRALPSWKRGAGDHTSNKWVASILILLTFVMLSKPTSLTKMKFRKQITPLIPHVFEVSFHFRKAPQSWTHQFKPRNIPNWYSL